MTFSLKNVNKTVLLLAVVSTLLFSACSKDGGSEGFDYGAIVNDVYTNHFFNCEFPVSPEWVVQSKEQNKEMMKRGTDLVAGDDKNMRRLMKPSQVNTANLLTMFKYEVGSITEFNPSLILVSENLKLFPGVKSGKQYQDHARKLFKRSRLKYDHVEPVSKKLLISGVEFYTMNASINAMGTDVHQRYYSTILNGFSFNIIISWSSDEEKDELEDMVKQLRFKSPPM